MPNKLWKTTAGVVALVAFALGGAAIAAGAGSGKGGTTTTVTTTASSPAHTPETPLAGEALAKVKAAAIAKVGGTIDAATTENDSPNAAAAYEAHVTKTDGSHVTVILDKDFNALAVEAGGGPRGHEPGGHGPGGTGETSLTGDVATKANAAAIAKVGGTADVATTENDGSNAAAAYEVHVTKTDGSHVTVILDKDYNVDTVEPGHGPGGPGPGHDGPGR